MPSPHPVFSPLSAFPTHDFQVCPYMMPLECIFSPQLFSELQIHTFVHDPYRTWLFSPNSMHPVFCISVFRPETRRCFLVPLHPSQSVQQPIVPVLSPGYVTSPSSFSPVPSTSPTEATVPSELLHCNSLRTGSPESCLVPLWSIILMASTIKISYPILSFCCRKPFNHLPLTINPLPWSTGLGWSSGV